MEQQRLVCQNCGELWELQDLHHSKAHEALCRACFRRVLKKSVEDDVKTQCQFLRDSISILLSPLTPKQVAILQAEVTTKRLAVDIKKAELVQKQRSMDNLCREIEEMDMQLRTLTMERISRKYRLNCVVPLDQIRFVLCSECTLRLGRGPVRRFVQSTESDGRTHQTETGCCSAKCNCM